MPEALIVYMAVHVGPGTGDARPFIRLRDGQYCEFFTPICMIRAEADYGQEKIAELRESVLADARRNYSK